MDDGAEEGRRVTELQAIETQRVLVDRTARLAEMEQSYLNKQRGVA